MSKVGRPSDYSPEIAAEICAQMASGMSLKNICAQDGMPGMRTVYQWFAAHPEFAQLYARAREDRADVLFEEILDIGDDGSNDWMKENDPDNPGYKLNGEHVQRSKLRCDNRKWAASKLNAKNYGDKTQTNLTINDKRDASDWTREELVALLGNEKNGSGGTPSPNGRGSEPDKLH